MKKCIYVSIALATIFCGCSTSKKIEPAQKVVVPAPNVFVSNVKIEMQNHINILIGKGAYVEAVEYLSVYEISKSSYSGKDREVVVAALKAVRLNLVREHILESLWNGLEKYVREEFSSIKSLQGWRGALAFVKACPDEAFRLKHNRLFALIDADVLGCGVLNKRLRALCEKLEQEIVQEVVDEQTSALVTKVDSAISRNDIADARKTINTWPKTGCAQADFILVATRIGVMNCYVNWRDFSQAKDTLNKLVPNPLPDDIEKLEKLEEIVAAFDVRRIDIYMGVGEAVDFVVKELAALKYLPDEYEKEIACYRKSIQSFLDGRVSAITERQYRNWAKYDEAMENVRQAILHHYTAIFTHELKIARDPMTTAELNRLLNDEKNNLLSDVRVKIYQLRAKIADEMLRQLQKQADENAKRRAELLQKRAEEDYRLALKGMGDQIDLDSQIAKAERVFAKMSVSTHATQHDIVDYAPILTEYARVLRKLELGQRINGSEATALLVGGAYVGELRVLNWAIRLGADIDGFTAIDSNKTTALMIALLHGEFEVFDYLVSVGASFGVKDSHGRTPIFYAAESGDLPLLRLAALKSDLNVADENGIRPVFVVARKNNSKLIEMLLDQGAEIGSSDNPVRTRDGDSVLEYASRFGAIKVMDVLYASGWRSNTSSVVKSITYEQLASLKWHVDHGARVDDPAVQKAAVNHMHIGHDVWCPLCKYLVERGVKLSIQR